MKLLSSYPRWNNIVIVVVVVAIRCVTIHRVHQLQTRASTRVRVCVCVCVRQCVCMFVHVSVLVCVDQASWVGFICFMFSFSKAANILIGTFSLTRWFGLYSPRGWSCRLLPSGAVFLSSLHVAYVRFVF